LKLRIILLYHSTSPAQPWHRDC